MACSQLTFGHRRSLFVGLALLCASVALGCSGARKAAPLTVHPPPMVAVERARDAWQLPHLVVERLRLEPGMAVADIGAGSGYLLPFLSRAVGPEGKVYAVEVQPQLVAELKKRVAAEHLDNVEVILSTEADAPLPQPVDRVILLHSYRELAQPVELLRSLKQRLEPTGRLFIVEFSPPPDPSGLPLPLPDEGDRVEGATIEAEARGAGLLATQRYTILPHQFFAMFVNAEEVTAAAAGAPIDPPEAAEPPAVQ